MFEIRSVNRGLGDFPRDVSCSYVRESRNSTFSNCFLWFFSSSDFEVGMGKKEVIGTLSVVSAHLLMETIHSDFRNGRKLQGCIWMKLL